MKNKKTFKLVMFPSEKASSLFIHINKLIFSPGTKQGNAPGTDPQILCIISNDAIRGGDWYLKRHMMTKEWYLAQCPFGCINDQPDCHKVISSTDKEITPYSWISETFVKAYVRAFSKGHPINEVEMEIDSATNKVPEGKTISWIKKRKDGSVIIHQSKSYSRAEVFKLMESSFSLGQQSITHSESADYNDQMNALLESSTNQKQKS